MSIKDFLKEVLGAEVAKTTYGYSCFRIEINQSPKLFISYFHYYKSFDSYLCFERESDSPSFIYASLNLEEFIDLIEDSVLKKQFLFNIDLFI